MTKEEYEKLLNSEYWKGFSYSLIKERNFTCEDCGRQFYGERNKLQVHHLVYRDVNPWSYKPEEMLVLCEECHKKRHGIVPDVSSNKDVSNTTYTTSVNDVKDTHIEGNYVKSYTPYSYTSNKKKANTFTKNKRGKSNRPKALILAYLIPILFLFFLIRIVFLSDNSSDDFEIPTVAVDTLESIPQNPSKSKSNVESKVISLSDKEVDSIVADVADIIAKDKASMTETENSAISTIGTLETDNKNDVVEKQEESNDSYKGLSTLEILERKNHADVVKQAKRAGVSTEGTTIEILERINRKEMENSNW